MKAWKVLPDQEPEEFEFAGSPNDAASGVINATLDFTKVRFRGKLRTMAVDDEGMVKHLPVNSIATTAYHANCKPGTVWAIHGPAVIFESVLR
jgi:hypothetical protein